ncbi:MAG TPA: tetratricopeptide repeat protein [Anaerolineales bacterium]|nr:tetratricopeptide repeat protein [Anaerolineales bacterium]
MEKELLLSRIHELEKELHNIRAVVQPPQKRKNIFKKTAKFLLIYWPILSVLAAIATVAYVQVVFKVDYFENYRSISTTKKLSEFYRQLGDNLLEKQEWVAAEAAYQQALEIDKNNTDATYGVVKSQVFQPLEGQKYYANEVVETKLDYLIQNFPDDYQVYYLKGLYYEQQNDYENAQALINKSLKINPNFVSGYIALGYINQEIFNLEEATKYLRKALEIEPNNMQANNNIGFCYILTLDFKDAIPHLQKAWEVSPNLLTMLNLGDAYLFSGDVTNALARQKIALKIIDLQNIENERIIQLGEWTYNFMPLQPGDKDTIKYYVTVNTAEYKKMFVHYDLSFGYALTGDFDSANKEFDLARELDTYKDYNTYFAYKIRSIENLVNMDDNARQWFETQRQSLETK